MTDDELSAIEAAFNHRDVEQAAAVRGSIFKVWAGGSTLVAEVRRLRTDLADAEELLREIRDGEVNPEDAADRFLRDHKPSELSAAREEVARLKRIIAAIEAEAALQSAHMDEYSDRLEPEEYEARVELIFTFRRMAHGVGPDGHEIK